MYWEKHEEESVDCVLHILEIAITAAQLQLDVAQSTGDSLKTSFAEDKIERLKISYHTILDLYDAMSQFEGNEE